MSIFTERVEERSLSFQDVWGSGATPTDMVSAGFHPALAVPAVAACVGFIAHNLSTCDVNAVRTVSDGWQIVKPTPAMLTDPSDLFSFDEWLFAGIADLLLCGNVVGVPSRLDGRGLPTKMEWLPATQVSIFSGDLLGRNPTYGFGGEVFTAKQVKHLRWWPINGRARGLSILDVASTSWHTGRDVARFGASFFAPGGNPMGVVETDQKVDDLQAAKFVDRFMTGLRGRRPIIMGSGTKYKPLVASMADAQAAELATRSTQEICALFHLAPEMIGAASGATSMTYKNTEMISHLAKSYTFQPIASKIARALSAMLPNPQFARIDIDGLVLVDELTRVQTAVAEVNGGLGNPNEFRAREKRPPIPDGDKYLWPPRPAPASTPPQGGNTP